LLEHPHPANGKQVKVNGDAVIALNKMVQAVEEQKMPKPASRSCARCKRCPKKRVRTVKGRIKALAERGAAEAAQANGPIPRGREASRRRFGQRRLRCRCRHPAMTSTRISAPVSGGSADLYPLVGTQVRTWREKPADQQAPQDLQRSLHTLKGSRAH